MSVRKRSWVTVAGESREVWAVAYTDQAGVGSVRNLVCGAGLAITL
jgi:hypothetical protein